MDIFHLCILINVCILVIVCLCNTYIHYIYMYNMDIYMFSVLMYVHATHVQQPCLLSPSALFFSVPHVAAVGGAPFVSPGSAKMPRKRFGQQSNIGPRWCALPFRLAANLQLAWIKSGQTNRSSVTPFRF